ncbi:MAG: IS630 family transposase [Candidatus Aenigmatarchaeota archaeon]
MEKIQLKGKHTKEDFLRLYKKSRDVRLRERYQALYLSFSFDWKTIAMIVGRDYETILTWVKLYNEKGLQGLNPDKPDGRPASLSDEQLKDLKNTVQTSPRNLGFKFSNWNCKNLKWFIKKNFSIDLCAERIRQILHELGFVLLRPSYKYVLADKRERNGFLSRFKDKFSTLRKNDLLMFLDEASVKQHPNIQPKWSLKGSKEFIGTFGNHAKVNVFGAISHVLGKAFHMKSRKLNSDIFIKFLEHLMMLNPTKHLVFVADNAPWHKSKKVLSFLENVSEKLEVLWLPAYSPDFNPIEHLWRFMKEVVLNFFFPKISELINAISDFFNSLYQKKQKIMTLCNPDYLLGEL